MIVRWSEDDTLAAAELTLRDLSANGIPVPAANRLRLSCDHLRRTRTFHVQYGHGDRSTELASAAAQRTIFEQYLITRGIRYDNATTRHKLAEMLGGPLVAQPRRHDRPRATQAELFTAAILSHAGFVVDWAEPDLLATKRSKTIGVAVKRVTGGDTAFRKRVRKAEQQLLDQGLHGFIVVSANALLTAANVANPRADLSALLLERTMQWLAYLRSRPDGLVLGVIGLATSFRLRKIGRVTRFVFHLHVHPRFLIRESEPEHQHVMAVGDDMMRSLDQSVPSLLETPAKLT